MAGVNRRWWRCELLRDGTIRVAECHQTAEVAFLKFLLGEDERSATEKFSQQLAEQKDAVDTLRAEIDMLQVELNVKRSELESIALPGQLS